MARNVLGLEGQRDTNRHNISQLASTGHVQYLAGITGLSSQLRSSRGCHVPVGSAARWLGLALRVDPPLDTRLAGQARARLRAIPTEPHAPKARPASPKREQKANEAPLLPPREAHKGHRGGAQLRVTHQWRPPPSTFSAAEPPKKSSLFLDAGASCDKLARAMEGCFSRDLLRGIGGGDALQREDGQRPPRVEMEEVELSLGLSLGGRFGMERRSEKLARSSSVASILTPPERVVAPAALARTSSLPVKVEAVEMGMEQGLHGWGPCRENGVLGAEAAARLPGSGSPSSASSDGEGQRLQDPLMRTTSLPAGFDDDSRKRKAAQSLKRHELKKKRIERRNSLTCNISKEAAAQIPEEMNANTKKLKGSNEFVTRNKQNRSNNKHLMNGLPPMHQVTFASRDHVSSAMQKKHNSTFKGTTGAEEHSPPSDVPLLGERDRQTISGRAAARAKSMGDAERIMMQEMPSVSTKGLPNGNTVEGFLYKYRKGGEVRIVCVCHGSFLTPAEFVKHAGGGDVANPLRHIVVNPTPQPFV